MARAGRGALSGDTWWVGYPTESPEKRKRTLSDVLHWEKY